VAYFFKLIAICHSSSPKKWFCCYDKNVRGVNGWLIKNTKAFMSFVLCKILQGRKAKRLSAVPPCLREIQFHAALVPLTGDSGEAYLQIIAFSPQLGSGFRYVSAGNLAAWGSLSIDLTTYLLVSVSAFISEHHMMPFNLIIGKYQKIVNDSRFPKLHQETDGHE
jgi:hypothetical protein